MYPYRVFLSYSSAERDFATAVADVFRELGLQVLWDHALIPGQPFSDEIKAQILRSHLFVPLVTRKSLARPWVHQETGYAMGVNVPILPIVAGKLGPVALIQQLQAIRIDHEPAQLKDLLTAPVIAARVDDAARTGHATFEAVDHPERRAQAIVEHARDAQRRGGGRIRQIGAITSFALPDVPPPDPIWRERDDPMQRSGFLHEQLYKERKVLGELAARDGCSLIIDPAASGHERLSAAARKIRLETLKAFLLNEQSFPDVRVVVRHRSDPGNLLIVGDWMCAQSITPAAGGYRQTLFTWHAPTVLARIKEFDSVFSSCRQETGRQEAASMLAEEIARLGEAAS
jgi:hypothetical protein